MRARLLIALRWTVAGLAVLAAAPAVHAANPWKGSWIWHQAPRETNYFRKVIVLGKDIRQAKVAITADNTYELYVNGIKVGADYDWTTLEVHDIGSRVRPGRNIIAAKATDPGADVGALLVEGAVTFADGSVMLFGTDGTWKISGDAGPGWTEIDFDDSGWASPREIGKPPIGPWGGIEHPSLAPKTPLEVVAVYWPKKAGPGDTVSVVCKVRPKGKVVYDSPVALRLLSSGATVFERWVDPEEPVTSWWPGQVVRLTFSGFRLPAYVPLGRLQAQVVTAATESIGSHDVWIGPRTQPRPAPEAKVAALRVAPISSREGRELVISADIRPRPNRVMVGLFRHPYADPTAERARASATAGRLRPHPSPLPRERELLMWFAADVDAAERVRVRIPDDLPQGQYEVRVFPHKMVCRTSPSVPVKLPGPEPGKWRPFGNGVYIDRDGIPHRWYISKAGALIWDGEPYIPAGAMYLSRFFMEFSATDAEGNEARFNEDMERLRQIRLAGITDLYLNPCNRWNQKPAWVWQRWADMCEELGINYGIQVTNQLEPLKGWHIAQDEYVISVKGGETATAQITGTYFGRIDASGRVLYSAFDLGSGDLVDWGKADVEAGDTGVIARATPRAAADRDISVHFIPEYTFNGDMHDYWRAIDDAYRRELDTFFSSLKLGPGFRLWIDPLDNEQSFRDLSRLLPHSDEFRAGFANYLKDKYSEVEKAAEAWAISPSPPSTLPARASGAAPPAQGLTWEGEGIGALARLVPLGTAGSDVGYALDETSGRTYRVDLTKSAMWYDMLRYRDSSIAEFNCRVADMIKRHHNAPVVLKATDTDCFTNLRAHGGFDGLGMEAYGAAPELVRGCGGGVYSRCKQANRTMWTLTTETGLAEEPCGYPDPVRMITELASMLEMNAKGTFYFLLCAPSGRPGEGWYIFNLFEDPRQLWWLGAYSHLIKSAPRLPHYEPEVSYYFPGLIAGERDGFSHPKPDYHRDIPSQSIPDGHGGWILPATTRIPPDAEHVLLNLDDPAWPQMAGGPARPRPDLLRDILGMTRLDLGRAFQHLSFNRTHYLWNLTDSDTELELALTPGQSVTVRFADGTTRGYTGGSVATLPLPANAARPVIVEGPTELALRGIDSVNLAAAMREYARAREKAVAVGLEAPVVPESGDWREIYRLAGNLSADAENHYRTARAKRTDGVSIDGNLAEWQRAQPIYLQMEVGVDFARRADYQGARFYVGYDSDYLYVAGEVSDEVVTNNHRLDGLWNGDAVEVMLDLRPDVNPNVRQYNPDCFQFIFAPTSRDGVPQMVVKRTGLPPNSVPEQTRWAVKRVESGWQFEAGIARRDINDFELVPGRVIGFTIQLDDADGGDRSWARLWRGTKDASRNRLGLGRLGLEETGQGPD